MADYRLPVDAEVTSSVLPTGAATEDKQDAEITTMTDGSQKSISRGGAKGATPAADVTSTSAGPDHQALDVAVYQGGAAVSTANRFPTATRPSPGSGAQSAALEASHVFSATPIEPSRISCTNHFAAVRYLHIFNLAAVPANGTTPIASRRISGNETVTIDYDEPTGRFTVGLVVALSTTQDTLTLAGAVGWFELDVFPAT